MNYGRRADAFFLLFLLLAHSLSLSLPFTHSLLRYAVTKCGDEVEWMPGKNFAVAVPPQGKALVAEDVWARTGECVRTNGANAAAVAAASEARQQHLELARAQPEGVASEVTLTGENYAKLTVKQLKALLKSRGLPVSGRKSELVARLGDSHC